MSISDRIKDGLKQLTKDVKTIAITCLQWGDTGKGKLVDLLASWAKIIARGTGGDNAGHSIEDGERKYVFHIVPSGILSDAEGKINIIGTGTVVYPKTLCQELSLLRAAGLPYNNLMLSLNAKLILPTHIVLDNIQEHLAGNSGKIGTTGKGIGPAYADYWARFGLVANDLLNPDIFASKLKRHLAHKRAIFAGCDPEVLKEALNKPHLDNGLYYDPNNIFSIDAIMEQYVGVYGEELKHLIRETDMFLQAQVGKVNILAEGAQGVLLSPKYGSYPFVTSSDSSVHGLAEGIGLTRGQIDLSLGIIKGFYETRVGDGPFPTEMGGKESDSWCNGADAKLKKKLELTSNADINDPDEFLQGVALRRAGNEYGATTGRPRRTGWLDLPLLKHALRASGSLDLVLTKLDVLDGVKEIKICTAYRYCGPSFRYGEKTISSGDVLEEAIPASEVLRHCQPIYEKHPGWSGRLKGISSFDSLPVELRNILVSVVAKTPVNVRVISIGADREDTIFA